MKKILLTSFVLIFVTTPVLMPQSVLVRDAHAAAAAAGAACGAEVAGSTSAGGAATGAGAGGTAANAALAVPVNDLSGNALLTAQVGLQTTLTTSEVASNQQWCWKEFVLDTLFFLLNNVLIEQLSASIVDWINRGFEGSPAFVQNLKEHWRDAGDFAFNKFLNETKIGKRVGFICSPFADKLSRSFELQLAVGRADAGTAGDKSRLRYNSQCTIESALNNIESSLADFQADFRNGGWSNWVRLNHPNNNQFGAYLTLRDELNLRQQEEIAEKKFELELGNGFLSWKQQGACTRTATLEEIDSGEVDAYDIDAGSPDEPNCMEREPSRIVTPGIVAEERLNQQLGSGSRRIEIADEIDEIIGALLSQLMNQLMSESGLFGASERGPDNRSYTDELRDSTDSSDYFGSTLASEIPTHIQNLTRYLEISAADMSRISTVSQRNDELGQCYQTRVPPDTNGLAWVEGRRIGLTDRGQDILEQSQGAGEVVAVLRTFDPARENGYSAAQLRVFTDAIRAAQTTYNPLTRQNESAILIVELDQIQVDINNRLRQCGN